MVSIVLAIALVGAALWGLSWKHIAEDLMYALIKEMSESEDEAE